MSQTKKVIRVVRDAPEHWVGNGFPVRTIFSARSLGAAISPFLLLDYGGPAEFAPSDTPRGVDEHPHRGFETVTIVYQGGVEHRDSAGNHGVVGPGDVQWMTAASGVVHEEKHSAEFTRDGGTFQVAQLWVNLPASQKMSVPRYQTLFACDIPIETLPDDAGIVRVIAGPYGETTGPAVTVTPIELWDLRLNAGKPVTFTVPAGHSASLFVVLGKIRISDEPLEDAQLVLFEREGDTITVQAEKDSIVLLLAGEPIDEALVSHGPFVMNTQQEITEAIADYRSGKMGKLAG